MSAIADAQNWPEAGVATFSTEERDRCRRFKIPGEPPNPFSRDPRYHTKRPTVDVGAWYQNHFAKLKGLEKAAGL